MLEALQYFLSIQFPEVYEIDIVPIIKQINDYAFDHPDLSSEAQRAALLGRILLGGAEFWLQEKFILDTRAKEGKCTKCGTPIFNVGVVDTRTDLELCVSCAEGI
jgi:hypothetical protein